MTSRFSRMRDAAVMSEYGLNQEEIAGILKVSGRTVSDYLNESLYRDFHGQAERIEKEIDLLRSTYNLGKKKACRNYFRWFRREYRRKFFARNFYWKQADKHFQEIENWTEAHRKAISDARNPIKIIREKLR